ncbi:MAG: hypothetical protein Q9202_002928 [Teloschistes flavicans]
MEAVQICLGSIEEPPQVINSNLAPHEYIEHRLKEIPELPLAILPEQPSLKAEPLTPSSGSTSKTGSEPRSATSTAHTSVLGPSQVFTVQKFHVSPSMPVDEKVLAVWTVLIKSRLSAVLLRSIPTGTCVQELMMAGKRQVNLKPTIVISCSDAATKRRVEKTFQSQRWLQDLLKTHHIMFVALVAETFLSAGPVLSGVGPVTLHSSYALEQLQSWHTTSCGLSLLTSGDESGHFQRRSTLGGLLSVNGTIVGLTAGHPFDRMNHLFMPEMTPQGGPEAEDASDETGSMISNEPFIFNGDEDDDVDGDNVSSDLGMMNAPPFENPTSFLDSDDQTPYHPAEVSTPREALGWHSPQATMLPASCVVDNRWDDGYHHDHDWALLMGLPVAVRSQHNKVAYDDSRHDIQITGTTLGPAAGEVVIATAAIGPQTGQLHSAPATMKVNKLLVNVQLIILEHALPRGNSGAWVVLEGKLCGYVVAVRQDLPWAYMVPIEPILEDIKRTLKTDDVRLPTAAEIESAAKPYNNPATSLWPSDLWPSEGYEQSLLNGMDRQSAAIQKNHKQLEGERKPYSLEELQEDPKASGKDLMKNSSELPNQVESEVPDSERHSKLREHRRRKVQEAEGSRGRRLISFDPEQEKTSQVSREIATGPSKEVKKDRSTSLIPMYPPASFPGLFNEKKIISSFNIWRRLESFILRLEYKRTKPWRRYRRFLKLLSVSSPGKLPDVVRTALSFCVTILYFICFFPLILWVNLRYGYVLAAVSDSFEPRRIRALRMLGSLPDRHEHDELIIKRDRLDELFGGSAV